MVDNPVNVTGKFPVNDPDHILTIVDDPDLREYIQKYGTIALYRDHYDDETIINGLVRNGFTPSKTNEILWAAHQSAFGDTSTIRLFLTLQEIAKQAWLEGDQADMKKEFSQAACWHTFDFTQTYDISECITWVISYESMVYDSNQRFQLVCKFKLAQKEVHDIMLGVFPKLVYTIVNDKLIITNNDLANYYKSKNNLLNI